MRVKVRVKDFLMVELRLGVVFHTFILSIARRK